MSCASSPSPKKESSWDLAGRVAQQRFPRAPVCVWVSGSSYCCASVTDLHQQAGGKVHHPRGLL